MKACTARDISNVTSFRYKLFHSDDIQSRSLCKVQLLPKQSNNGLRWKSNLSPRAAKSDEKASDTYLHIKDDERESPLVEYAESTEMKEDDGAPVNEVSHEASWFDSPKQLFKFLEDFDVKDMKLDYEELYSILVFGGGGVVALWLAASVVNAIDSIPLFPKALELVGLGYTVWFSSRYLIFKKNRDELLNKIEEIKLQVMGSKDE